MPSRTRVARDLAEMLRVVAHPDRIRLIEELGAGECDVGTLSERLALTGPRVSQHLALLRTHRVVSERRAGRYRFYRLAQPRIADWILDGLSFLEGRARALDGAEISTARRLWATAPSRQPSD